MNDRFERERMNRKDLERKYTNVIEDRFNTLKIEISKESRTRFDSIENLKSYLEVIVSVLFYFRTIFQNFKD